MSDAPEWTHRKPRVEVRYGDDHPYGIVFVDGREVPFVTRIQLDYKAEEVPQVILTIDALDLVVAVDADVTTEQEPAE